MILVFSGTCLSPAGFFITFFLCHSRRQVLNRIIVEGVESALVSILSRKAVGYTGNLRLPPDKLARLRTHI